MARLAALQREMGRNIMIPNDPINSMALSPSVATQTPWERAVLSLK